jgi:hypothetical protein
MSHLDLPGGAGLQHPGIDGAVIKMSDGELSPHDVGFKLNDVLVSAIAASKKAKYGKPREAFKDLMNGIQQ